MDFRLACGHTVSVMPWQNWLRVIREPCMRCHLEKKGAIRKEQR